MYIDKLTAKYVDCQETFGPTNVIFGLDDDAILKASNGLFLNLETKDAAGTVSHSWKWSTKMSGELTGELTCTAKRFMCSLTVLKPGLLSSQFTTISALHGSLQSRKSWAHLDLKSESVFWLIWCLMWLELLLEPLKWTLGAKSKNYIDIGDAFG